MSFCLMSSQDDDQSPNAKWEEMFEISGIVKCVNSVVSVGPCVEELTEVQKKPTASCCIA